MMVSANRSSTGRNAELVPEHVCFNTTVIIRYHDRLASPGGIYPMPHACKYCASERVHRSHRAGFDYVAAFLFGQVPYRCLECGQRFRVERGTARTTPAVNGAS